ncbi:MAG: Tic20 family protein [Cyanobacteria bacterium J06639_14]
MTWRGTTTVKDRFFSCLPYALPLLEVSMLGLMFAGSGIGLFAQFPPLQLILIPLMPLILFYNLFSFGGFSFGNIVIFLLLLTLIVRNTNIPHFIRFNTMQAILLDILLFLARIILMVVLAPIVGTSLFMDTILNVVLLGTLAAIGYSIVQTLRGQYAEIPTLSEAVYMQVR